MDRFMNLITYLFLLILISIKINQFNADSREEQLRIEKSRLFGVYRQKCSKYRLIKVGEMLTLLNYCARQSIIESGLIPGNIFPERFERVTKQCLHTSINPEWNVCQRSVLNTIVKCYVQKDLGIWIRLNMAYQISKESWTPLFNQIMNDCSQTIDLIKNHSIKQKQNYSQELDI
ncbi:hypothetical protein SSS_05165 [Sarcoptes scabiei]|uniref:Uncharacterized protein n=1 Tax=Sarcoptes scabiei TaxID=52283 RepID=A0A834VFW5_SARSC|nr:hypothetical protein SSS_05165 [Sarcoptes scabiei]UXI22433.1 inositol 1 4 5 trisphosphate receptor [Sarcoptes scabiei]